MPLTELHWIISDSERSVTLEAVKEGIRLYDNKVGVLTNSPCFDMHMLNLNNFMSLSADEPKNTFSNKAELNIYSRGMGAIGMPGDVSSMSRFVRAAFVKLNSVSPATEAESVNQFFHILRSVEMQRGCVRLAPGIYDITVYTSCCNTDKGIYYYSTYDNSQINAVDMHREDLNSDKLISYPLNKEPIVMLQN